MGMEVEREGDYNENKTRRSGRIELIGGTCAAFSKSNTSLRQKLIH